MNNLDTGCHNMVSDSDTLRKHTLKTFFQNSGEDPPSNFPDTPSQASSVPSSISPTSTSTMSPTSTMMSTSPLAKSPWCTSRIVPDSFSYTGLMGSLYREQGHIYSVAASGEFLYTGSESKNIRVWKNQKEFSSFKSNSGFVKTIIISGNKIFSGHQDGKIRIWKPSRQDPSLHKRVGSLPTFKAKMKNKLSLSSYLNSKWLQHTDAISCLALSGDRTLLYSASWDRTFKVWRLQDSKCLETVRAHDDAVNAIVASGFDSLVFTGSADGTVKVWRREVIRQNGKEITTAKTKHYLTQMLLKQECAVTSLAVDPAAGFLYCGSSDGMVNFWDRRKVLCHSGVLKGHRLAVLCLATAGNLVFSGSADTNICVWRREEGRHVCLSVLIGHTGPVKCLTAVEEENTGCWGSEDRRYTVHSGGIDQSVKIWRVTTQMNSAADDMRMPSSRRGGEFQQVGRLLK